MSSSKLDWLPSLNYIFVCHKNINNMIKQQVHSGKKAYSVEKKEIIKVIFLGKVE